tara:strand:+ start:846 stop:1358 length:513 start_codon:yes stop_codon:yes gene_type:complete
MREPSFDAPIAGQSLTNELGGYPWQQPAQYTTVEEAMTFYLPKLKNEEYSDSLLDVLQMGVPVTTIANTVQMAGVMEGKHSIDVGVLILPVLIEAISLIAEEANIEFETGLTNTDDKPSVSKVALAMKQNNDNPEENDTVVATEEIDPVVEPDNMEDATLNMGGLMGRRV